MARGLACVLNPLQHSNRNRERIVVCAATNPQDVPSLFFRKSSTSYLLRTLVGRGYVRRDGETGQHTLGIRILSLGGQAMQGMALRDLAMPHLRQIVETTRLGSHLAILDHGDAVYIERIES